MPDLFGRDDYGPVRASADISPCGKYRYWLCRAFEQGGNGKTVSFVMLNPSTADALQDDPTIRRCLGFVRSWGYSVLHVVNLFSLRATNPAELRTATDPVGPYGDIALGSVNKADLVVAAWGAKVPFGRDLKARVLLANVPLHCLERTKDGHPRHPLYCRADLQPVPFS